ncbi:hypothetical protein KUCAC02_006622, partial [Chaenocephalus aceratus]
AEQTLHSRCVDVEASGRRYTVIKNSVIASRPGSRDRRERWSQKAYQKSIHNGPHYSFKRRSHSPLQPSHHPAPQNHSASSFSISVVLFSDT